MILHFFVFMDFTLITLGALFHPASQFTRDNVQLKYWTYLWYIVNL